MAAKKKSAKKKRNISKHVLKARETKQNPVNGDEKTESSAVESPNATKIVSKKIRNSSSNSNKHIKDPSEAEAYLTSWEKRDQGEWKFNKNTQSWLIRHMYEVDKVSKGTFKLLLEYLHGLQGDTMRSRIRTEASRRALRYKEHVKKSASTNADYDDASNDANEKKDSLKNEEEEPSKNNTNESPKDKNAASKQELLEEESRWNALNENDKRKEYKRARIVLDTFKE